MPKGYYIRVPTWSPSQNWHYTTFTTKVEWREYVKSLFKEPGLYNLDEISYKWNEHARTFNKKKLFCEAPEGSRDYQEFWDTEKEKCRKGVIFKNDNGEQWYLTRWYYHWLNYLRIYNKRRKVFAFADIMDHQYHVCLYEMCAILHGKDEAALKKRQMAWSYLHEARMYNHYIFDSGFVGKMMASDKKYINSTGGEWKYLEEYHNFTNKETAWDCSNMPHKEFSWQQKVETKTPDGRKVQIGTKATISGITLDKDPISGVGGACDLAIYVEGGIAPTANITHGFMKPAMKDGAVKTGSFNIGGSVGDLEQCDPLKDMIYNPEAHDIYAIKSTLTDENGTEAYTGLFIPEQWGYVGETEEENCVDQYGNSLVEKALNLLNAKYEKLKAIKKYEDYQLAVSQGPRYINEAFAIRKLSVFPVKHTTRQVKRIESGEVFLKYVDLERVDGEIVIKKAQRVPMEYPSSKTAEDKRGCVVIHQHPEKNPEWMSYFWSADPVETGNTTTSESLAALYIYMNSIQVTKIDENGESKTFIEGDKLVAEWVGRYDDVNDTNEQMSMLIEYYNAYGISEKNKPSLNTYMILKKRVRYLATSDEMIFDAESSLTPSKHYGWINTTGTWRKILQYGVESLSEELEEPTTDDKGKATTGRYGVERIPFIWLLKEMQVYDPKKNFDRVIAYCALIAFVKLQQAKQGIKKRTIQAESTTHNKKIRTFDRQSFLKSIGKPDSKGITQRGMVLKSIGR